MSKLGEAKEHILTLLDDIEGGGNFHPCYDANKFLTEMRESVKIIETEYMDKINKIDTWYSAFVEGADKIRKMKGTLGQIQSIAVKSTSLDPSEFGSLFYQILMSLSDGAKAVAE